jgi:O-antigen ligase
MQLSNSERFSQLRPDARHAPAPIGRSDNVSAETMSISFKLFLIWTFVLIGRPQDYLPFLVPLRIALIFTIPTLIATLCAQKRLSWGELFKIGIARKYTLLFLLMIIGIPFADHRGIAFVYVFFYYVVNMVYFYLAVLQLDSFRKIRATVYVLSLSVLFYGLFGLALGQIKAGRFFFGTMYDPNDIALFMVGMFPMSIVFLGKTNKTLTRVMAAAVIAVAPLITFMSASRGGLLSLAVVLVILFLTRVGNVKRSYKIAVVGLLVSLLFLYSDKLNLDRYYELLAPKQEYNITSDTGRLRVWETAFTLIAANPITGVGAGCFPRAFGYERGREGLPPAWKAAHNAYIEIWAEVGFPGIIVFLAIIFGCLKSFLRTMRRKLEGAESADISSLSGLILIGFAGYLVGSFFLSQAFSLQFTLFFAFAAVMDNPHLREMNSEVVRHDLVFDKNP